VVTVSRNCLRHWSDAGILERQEMWLACPSALVEEARVLEYSQDRPWGSWHVLDEGPGYKVKRIEVMPGQRLSYQTHEYRSEHWLVIFGIATCVLDGATKVAGPGDCIEVDHRVPHRIENKHSELLVIIEVQRGPYTGEDDIFRLEDDYGRHDDPVQDSPA